MSERSRKLGHVALVVLYWFALVGLIGEQGDPKTANGTGVFLIWVLILFGIWRVARKQLRLRRERRAQVPAAGVASIATESDTEQP